MTKRGQQRLTAQQEALLERANEVDRRWREAKRTAAIEIRKQVQRQIDMHSTARDQAVWDCVEAGIPKSRIGREGLGTTSPNAVYEIIDRVAKVQEITQVDLYTAPAGPKYSWGKVKEAVYTKGAFYAYLRIEGDDHEYRGNKDIPGDKGYVFFRLPDGRWVPADYNDPGEAALAWAAENPPE